MKQCKTCDTPPMGGANFDQHTELGNSLCLVLLGQYSDGTKFCSGFVNVNVPVDWFGFLSQTLSR